MNPNVEVLLFTIIETVVLAGWLALVLAGHLVASIIVLLVGLFFEHFTAYNTGTGQPFLRFPLRRP